MAPLTNATQSELLDSCLTNKLHRLSLATFDDEGTSLGLRQKNLSLKLLIFFQLNRALPYIDWISDGP